MKKIILPLILIVLVLALAACGGTASEPEAANPVKDDTSATGNSDGSAADGANGDDEFNISTETMLMLGTIQLDETDSAVDAEQASALLPLWKALRSFGESETAAQIEVDALVAQIEDTMTPEQISTIEGMQLTQQDITSVAETLGIEMGGFGGGGFGEMTPEMQATREAMRESGESSGGGPGSGQGMGGGLGGAEMDPDARATAMAERSGARGARSGISSFLLDGIIEFLEAKVQ